MKTEVASGQPPRLWQRARQRALIPYIVFGALLVVGIALLGREISQHIAAIEAWIQRIGPWGIVVFIGLFAVLTSGFMPDTVLAIIAGALFGLAGGTFAVIVGALAAAALQFALARRLLRARIARTLSKKPSMQAIQRAVNRQEFRLQVLLRLTPLSPTAISYLLGAGGVRFPGFLIACLAQTPNLFMEVYIGHAGKHLAKMAGRDTRAVLIHDAAIVSGLIVCVVVMIIVSRMARKAMQEAVAEGKVEASSN